MLGVLQEEPDVETALGTVKEISTPPILREEGGENERHPLEVGREVTSPKAGRSRIYLGKVRGNVLILTCKGYCGHI